MREPGSQPRRRSLQRPSQQGWPSSPHSGAVIPPPHAPSRQVGPCMPQDDPGATQRSPCRSETQQALPAHAPSQQRRPTSPQAAQTPTVLPPSEPLQLVPGRTQPPRAQQGSPRCPQATQPPATQRAPAPVQAPLGQQGCPSAPQVPHEPSAQTPGRAPQAA